MKTLATLAALLMYVPNTFAVETTPDHWYNRPAVIQAGQRLANEIEHFDETLHDVHAPAHVIQKTHHFEETVTEFVTEVKNGLPYNGAYQEFQHIREDIRMIRKELQAHPHLMTHGPVAQEWYHVWASYRKLDHEMYHNMKNRLSPEELAKLDAEIAAIDAAH